MGSNIKKSIQKPVSALIILLLFSTPFFMPIETRAATVTWDGGAGTSNWEDDLNWSGDVTPTGSDDVVIDTAVTVNINAATTVSSVTLGVSGGGTASILNFDYDAVGGSPLTITNDLTVYSGANVTHTAGTSAVVGSIDMVIGGDATITGTININGKGYFGGEGPGTSVTSPIDRAGGGSYGGRGGNGGYSDSGPIYGSMTNPTDLGSGGGNSIQFGAADTGGGAGGGVVLLDVTGTLTVNGSITSNGQNAFSCWSPGGGSGGSINITTGTLSGSGSITANGGHGCNYGGDGGGGRIAVNYTTDSSSVTYQNHGYTHVYVGVNYYSGAGTIYKKSAAQNFGDLILENNNIGGSDERVMVATPLGLLATDPLEFDSITATSSARFYLASSTVSSLSASTTFLILAGNGMYEAISTSTLEYGSITWT